MDSNNIADIIKTACELCENSNDDTFPLNFPRHMPCDDCSLHNHVNTPYRACPINIHMNDRRPCEVCPMNRLILSEKRRCDLNCNKHVLVNFNCLGFPTITINK